MFTAPKAAAGLHLVATPIGNLGDITLRALETLAGVDLIACEDTRITRRLTERYGIAAELTPYHEHNAATARPKILARLAQGAFDRLGLRRRHAADFRPRLQAGARGLCGGPCGDRAAGTVVGAGGAFGCGAADRPVFLRRFSAGQGNRAARALAELARIDATLVLFESGNRVQATLADLADDHGRARGRDLPRADQAA